jgi:hypothetical protein
MYDARSGRASFLSNLDCTHRLMTDASLTRKRNRAMMDTIKQRAPFHLKDLASLAQHDHDTFASWSAGRRTPPDEAFPPIADALDAKAKELRALAREIRRKYRTP